MANYIKGGRFRGGKLGRGFDRFLFLLNPPDQCSFTGELNKMSIQFMMRHLFCAPWWSNKFNYNTFTCQVKEEGNTLFGAVSLFFIYLLIKVRNDHEGQ